MLGWALIVIALAHAVWLGILAAVLLATLWLWWVWAKAEPGSDRVSMILFAVTWAAWALTAWVVVLFASLIGVYVGARLGLWRIEDE
jgi:hypothetical protein